MTKEKRAFLQQKRHAKRRGIGWELTFEQWIQWWGADIAMRGVGMLDLQMQRPMDSGPYALWNIRKGTPKANARTRAAVKEKARREAVEKGRGALFADSLFEPSIEPEDRPDWHELGYATLENRFPTY